MLCSNHFVLLLAFVLHHQRIPLPDLSPVLCFLVLFSFFSYSLYSILIIFALLGSPIFLRYVCIGISKSSSTKLLLVSIPCSFANSPSVIFLSFFLSFFFFIVCIVSGLWLFCQDDFMVFSCCFLLYYVYVVGRLAQLARASGLHPEGRRFEPCIAHLFSASLLVLCQRVYYGMLCV